MRTISKLNCLALTIVLIIYFIVPSSAEIHRARALRQHKPRRPVFDDEDLSPPGVQYPYNDHNIPSDVADPYVEQESLRTDKAGTTKVSHYDSQTWIYSLISAALVGLSGIFPLLIIRIDDKNGQCDKEEEGYVGGSRLRLLLSFAVGGLLGDVFLHLLPETWAHLRTVDEYMMSGLWVIAGLLSFLLIEKIFPDTPEEDSNGTIASADELTKGSSSVPVEGAVRENGNCMSSSCKQKNNNKSATNGITHNGECSNNIHNNVNTQNLKNSAAMLYQGNGSVAKAKIDGTVPVANGKTKSNGNQRIRNGSTKNTGKNQHDKLGKVTVGNGKCTTEESKTSSSHIKTSGWLNLLANVIDNFTHGLAVAASYSVSTKTGLLTTGAILLHEVPHEIGDFAILLRSGFDRWKAAKAQLITASGGICGAFVALCASSVQEAGNQSSWMLPFTSGGFLYIALVTVLPDLLNDKKPMESLKQMLLLLLGISVMSLVTLID